MMNKFSKVKVGEQIALRRKSFTVVAIFEDLGKTYYVCRCDRSDGRCEYKHILFDNNGEWCAHI